MNLYLRWVVVVSLPIVLGAVGLENGDNARLFEPAAEASASSEKPTTKKSSKDLTLEDLFPEKGLFGPSASSTEFSHDGSFAAYLYRPYLERRHGNDLWILDTAIAEPRRITSVSVMAEFQADTRKVKEDRVKKAKKEKKKDKKSKEGGKSFNLKSLWSGLRDQLDKKSKTKGEKGDGAEKSKKDDGHATTQEVDTEDSDEKEDKKVDRKKDNDDKVGEKDKDGDELGDHVGKKDADDEKAPRYAGIRSLTWSPVADELLFTSGGDIYRLLVTDDKIVRLTRTAERERDVQYLPDGSGYTYMRGAALIRVTFASHLIEQLDPKLPTGESMSGYRLSPNGKRIVFLSSKQGKPPEPGRKVKIAKYRDRFMDVTEVSRHVSDDPLTPTERSVYIYELDDPMHETGKPIKVYTHEVSGPRDIMRVPEWSPDSDRVTFAVYEQSSEHVEILEAEFPPAEDKEKDKDAEKKKDADGKKGEGSDSGEKKKKDDGSDRKKDDDKDDDKKDGDKKEDDIEKREAKVVYRFLHDGGPNTPSMVQPRYLADSHRIVFLSEHTGFRQLHVLDPLYEAVEQLTRGRYETYPIDITQDHKWMFVTATKEHPARQDIYRVSTEDGTMTRLSKKDGTYTSVAVSPDGTKHLANFATFGTLPKLLYSDGSADAPKILTDSHSEKTAECTATVPEFFTYKNRHGHDIHGYMMKPDDWTPRDKRPLLIYVYGGPLGRRKMVVDGSYSSDGYLFASYMTNKHGFVTCTIDPRGTSGYGGLFEKSNFEQAGKPQVEDLVDGVKWFVENHAVDEKRVGIHGWSFGGFQTQMCLYTEPDVFACGIAGAGPTEWENYNSWYSTGTIGKSRTGKTDLKKFSLLPLAKNLKSRLLLVHGMEDPNVLYQDTVRVYRELLKAGKETLVELFLDTTGQHGLGGDVKRLGRARKYEEFLVRNLGEGKPSDESEPIEAFLRRTYTKHEYRISMRDGVKLFTAVYTPNDASTTYPILLFRTPYDVGPYGEDAFPDSLRPNQLGFARDGYIFAFQDVRGCYMSEGEYENMRPHIAEKSGPEDVDESTDTYDTIEWLLENVSNNNGRVGMWGISYPGFYAAAGMIDAHPALKAVSPQAPIADWWYDDFHHHGAFFLAHAFRFFPGFGQYRPEPTTQRADGLEFPTADGYQFYLDLGPLSNVNDRYLHGDNPMWNRFVEHPNYDEYWQARSIVPHLNNVAPAVMTVGGWYDAEDLYGPLKIYESIEDKNPDISNVLVMGPWVHGGWGRRDGDRVGNARFGDKTGVFYRENIERPFFAHHLKDGPDPELPEAYAFETGANVWHKFDDWPPVDVESRTLRFLAGGRLAFDSTDDDDDFEDDFESDANSFEDPGFDEFISDPFRPVPYTEAVTDGMTKEYMTDDQRFAARRPDVLVYQTDPLDEPVTLAGPILADLWVSTSGTASDWIVKLIDVYPCDASDPDGLPAGVRMAGYQMMIRSESIRGRFRDDPARPEPFEPNEPTRIRLELLDVLHTFGKGHRIMVQIQCTWFPLVDRNPQSYVKNVFLADESDFRTATQRVYRVDGHSTRLRVGVLPGEGEDAD